MFVNGEKAVPIGSFMNVVPFIPTVDTILSPYDTDVSIPIIAATHINAKPTVNIAKNSVGMKLFMFITVMHLL
jgi:hypothetical protein